jgi:hypothetical protein
MKKIILLLLCFTALVTHAQNIKCKDTTYKVSYSEVLPDTSYYNVFEITGYRNDTTWKIRCGRACKLGFKGYTGRKVIDHITQVPVYDSVQHALYSTYTITITEDSPATVCHVIPTQFGAKVQDGTSEQQMKVLNALNVLYVRPVAIEISSYVSGVTKLNRLTDLSNSDFLPVVNFCWFTDPNKKPWGFNEDTAKLRSQVRAILKDVGFRIKRAIFENEPSNDGFYGATASMYDYLTRYKIFAEECIAAGVDFADGCLHFEVINQMALNDVLPNLRRAENKSVVDQRILLAGLKNIPGNKKINAHFFISGDNYPDIVGAVNYIRAATGLDVVVNEFHMENATQKGINGAIQALKDANIEFAIIFGGGGSSDGDPINDLKTFELTDQGKWYRDAIAK